MTPTLSAAPELARSRSYLALLTGLMEEFSQARRLDANWSASVLTRIAEAMDAEAASLFLLEGNAEDPRARLVCQASVGPSSIDGLSLPTSSGVVGRSFTSGEPQLVADVAADPDFVAPPNLGAQFEVRSLLCAPLAAMGQTLGVVELVNRRAGAHFTEQDRDTLGALAAAAALALLNARFADERVEQEKLQRELELAGEVQRNLLPRNVPAQSAVHGYNRPARGVSGDFYDLLILPDGRTVFALADVSGKGMNAALIMVKAATLFRTFARRVPEPGRLLARIEAELAGTMSMGMFVTMVVGLYDPRTQEVRLSNAGHEPPLLRSADGEYREFPASDPPLGVVSKLEKNRYRETRIELAGGALYLYTDGATEGRLPDGEIAGSEGVRALIEQHRDLRAAERLEALAAHYGEDLHDDLTWLVVEESVQASITPRARRRGTRLLVAQSIPAQTDQLKIVRRLVQAAAQQAGASVDWGADLALAVDEACQNIIRHGYRTAEGRIQLLIRREGAALRVELQDQAPAISPSECQGRALDEIRPGGLGTHFMRDLTDRVRFLKPQTGIGNRLVLSKRLIPTPKDKR